MHSHLLLSRSRHGEARLQQNRYFSTEKGLWNIPEGQKWLLSETDYSTPLQPSERKDGDATGGIALHRC